MYQLLKRKTGNPGVIEYSQEFDSIEQMLLHYKMHFSTLYYTRNTDMTIVFGSELCETFRHPNPLVLQRDVQRYCSVLYGPNGKIVSPEMIAGIQKRVRFDYFYGPTSWDQRKNNKSDRGKKKMAYGHLRNMKTVQERRMTFYVDDDVKEYFNVKIRGRRSAKSLPNPWDDFYSGTQKSWKKQSKRSHQYKEKATDFSQ